MAGKGDINKRKIQPEFSANWLTISFGSVLEKTSITHKLKSKDFSSEGLYPVVDQGGNLISGFINDVSKLYKDALPIIVFGDHTRNIKYIDFEFAVGADGTKILKAKKGVNDKFLYFYLLSLNIPNFGYSRHYSIFKEIDFPLPPLAEQERIVAKLDALFAHHETIKKALERIPQLLKDFRQQILSHAVTGKLTEQWRKGKDLDLNIGNKEKKFRKWNYAIPTDWKTVAFEDVVEIKSNLVDPDDYTNYHLIAPDNIESNTGKILNSPLVSEIKPKSGKHLFNEGVIIYSKIRPYLNKLIITDFKGLCSADMYPIDKTDFTEIGYIFYFMLSREFLNYSTTAGERSVLPKINQKGLNEIPFPLPTLQEQQEIIHRLESLFAKADAIESQYKKLKEKTDSLPQAILHKAFKGELVPQLPTDGDAKYLLAEIMALKKEITKKKK